MGRIMKDVPASLAGLCDVFVEVESASPRILQLTDMQIIDADQRRTPDRISEEKIRYWASDRVDANLLSHIRDLVAQSRPELILITGDIVYGEFDDSGRMQQMFADFLDRFEIPWAITFGNHDNESAIGIENQCRLYENTRFGLFRRGTCTGFGNYTVGLVYEGKLIRVLYLLDSHGCGRAFSPEAKIKGGLYPDQLEMVKKTAEAIEARTGAMVPGFAAYHIPTKEFVLALQSYGREIGSYFTIGAEQEAVNGDFGYHGEKFKPVNAEEDLTPLWRDCGVDGIFAGHCHKINTSILYNGVRLTFGLKTGVYDYFTNGQLGGTVIDCTPNGTFGVHHLTTLVPYDPPFDR